MMPLLSYLREAGVTPAAKLSHAPLEGLLVEYRIWLVRERGLAAATVLRYENTARRFLQQQAMAGGVLNPAGLTGADVNAFLLRECGRISAGSAKGRVAELRAILRFLYLQDLTPLRLGTAVPPVGGWRLAALPPAMPAADVQLLLDRCDRSTDVGVRDFAIMMLVARLGLRSIERVPDTHDVTRLSIMLSIILSIYPGGLSTADPRAGVVSGAGCPAGRAWPPRPRPAQRLCSRPTTSAVSSAHDVPSRIPATASDSQWAAR
jgi:hypothetical protein